MAVIRQAVLHDERLGSQAVWMFARCYPECWLTLHKDCQEEVQNNFTLNLVTGITADWGPTLPVHLPCLGEAPNSAFVASLPEHTSIIVFFMSWWWVHLLAKFEIFRISSLPVSAEICRKSDGENVYMSVRKKPVTLQNLFTIVSFNFNRNCYPHKAISKTCNWNA